jgi:hypothetical protein
VPSSSVPKMKPACGTLSTCSKTSPFRRPCYWSV